MGYNSLLFKVGLLFIRRLRAIKIFERFISSTNPSCRHRHAYGPRHGIIPPPGTVIGLGGLAIRRLFRCLSWARHHGAAVVVVVTNCPVFRRLACTDGLRECAPAPPAVALPSQVFPSPCPWPLTSFVATYTSPRLLPALVHRCL